MLIRLVLLSGNGIAFEKECERFVVPSFKGDMEVSPGYIPIIEGLDKVGIVRVYTPEKPYYFVIFDGVLSVEKSGAFIVASSIEEASSIDLARANNAKDRAERRLASKQENIDITRAQAALNRALVRIRAKKLFLGEKPY